jgi:hypothetical protein
MLTLPDRFEFLSDAWIDEARRFLTRATEQRKDELGGQPFSLSERFADAPPHLGLPGAVGAWTARYDGEAMSVARGFDPAADVVVEGDYQAGLAGGQFIGMLAPGAMKNLRREIAALHGPDALKMSGRIENRAAGEILSVLHDHLGRRTVENPDLAHRAERQGLTRHIREMEEQGYTIVERAISPEFADEVRAATLRALLPHQSVSMNWMLYHGREFEQLIQNPKLMTLIDASLGRGAVIASFSCIKKATGPAIINLHTDYAHVPEPFPEFSLTGVGVWALEDWTVPAGPTWIIPGSHKLRRNPRPGEAHNGGVPIEMPKGSVVYFHHGVWHWQGDRELAGDRVTLHAHFNRGILRSLEPKKVDVQMLHRNSPRLAEMLGEDDWFDKLSAQGRDYGRFGYMNKLHAFTEEKRQAILAGA